MFHLCCGHQTKKNPIPTALGMKAFEGQAAHLFIGCAFRPCCCVTALWRQARQPASVTINVVRFFGMVCLFGHVTLSVTGSNQAYRAISTGQLNALLRLHLRPIGVVVFHGPQGYLVLRGASRLDAFSGYPVRS